MTGTRRFAELHAHTEYSLLDGTTGIEALVQKARELGFLAVAMTDLSNLYGAVKFYCQAAAQGLRPIIGCEAEVWGSGAHAGTLPGGPFHLVLLAKDARGYKNLCRIATMTHRARGAAPPWRTAPVTYEELRADSEGLIALSRKGAGRGEWGIDPWYLKPPEELARAFREIPEALDNTLKVAERCNLRLEALGINQFDHDPAGARSPELERLCVEGLISRYPQPRSRALERLREELELIKALKLEPYFLAVHDIVRLAREHGIAVGPGRGSAAGSLVAYCLGITQVDPLEHNLSFHRFLNPQRAVLPDYRRMLPGKASPAGAPEAEVRRNEVPWHCISGKAGNQGGIHRGRKAPGGSDPDRQAHLGGFAGTEGPGRDSPCPICPP